MEIENKVIEFHNRYSEIVKLQRHLPIKKGKTDYSEIEHKIIEDASKLSQEIYLFTEEIKRKQTESKFILQLENLDYGAKIILRDPYKKIS